MSANKTRVAQMLDVATSVQLRSIDQGAAVGEGYSGQQPVQIRRGAAFWQDADNNALDGTLLIEGQIVSINDAATYAIVVKAGPTSGTITEIARVEVSNVGPWALSIDPALFGDADEWLGIGVEITGTPNGINWSAQLRYVTA